MDICDIVGNWQSDNGKYYLSINEGSDLIELIDASTMRVVCNFDVVNGKNVDLDEIEDAMHESKSNFRKRVREDIISSINGDKSFDELYGDDLKASDEDSINANRYSHCFESCSRNPKLRLNESESNLYRLNWKMRFPINEFKAMLDNFGVKYYNDPDGENEQNEGYFIFNFYGITVAIDENKPFPIDEFNVAVLRTGVSVAQNYDKNFRNSYVFKKASVIPVQHNDEDIDDVIDMSVADYKKFKKLHPESSVAYDYEYEAAKTYSTEDTELVEDFLNDNSLDESINFSKTGKRLN